MMNPADVRGLPGDSRTRTAAAAALLSLLLVAGCLIGVTAPPAAGDTAPWTPGEPATVSADALPTVQINGVVWDQVIIGNRVYATGSFTRARPAGAAPGTNETVRNNVLAYDITTGQLITSWAPSLNQQGLAITASADGSRVYVGGDFTSVSSGPGQPNQNRQRVVALDAQTGVVVPGFAPVANNRVQALAVNGSTLYVGGFFTAFGGQPRSRLGAWDTATNTLLDWAPQADLEVVSMTVHPASGRVIAGGSFEFMNGIRQLGMTSLDGVTGAVMPWVANTIIRNYGANTAITSLTTDGQAIFGTGRGFFAVGGTTANFEGIFSANPLTGELNWINGCRGDELSVAVTGDVVYTAGHPHECGMVGFRPETNPRTWQWALAIDKRGTPGMENAVGSYADWEHFDGLPASKILHWLPTFSPGTYTGSGQAGWSVEANSQYAVYGGEFPRVNGTNQQGLVRFAVRSLAPNNNAIQGYPDLLPVATPLADGTVRIEWQAPWDRDNERLTYEVLRGATVNSSTVLKTFTFDSNWWTRPPLGFVDTTAPPGTNQTYRIRVMDATGNGFAGPAATVAVPAGAATASPYRQSVLANGAFDHWRLNEASGTAGYDWANADDLTLSTAAVRGVPGALLNEADTATSWPGTTNTGTVQGASQSWLINAADPEPSVGPQVFSVEAWFNTTTTTGGKIVGFGDSRTFRSGTNRTDRHIYMTNNGEIRFGLRPDVGARRTITSAPGYNNGQWHHVVATLSGDGANLYIDGVRVANDPTLREAQVYFGYWRVAGDRLSNWPSAPTTEAFAGAIDEVAIYKTALTQAQVQANYNASGRTAPSAPPTAAFSSTVQDLTVSFDASGSFDPDGGALTYAWDFGDGTSGTGVNPVHPYPPGGGTYNVTLTVTDVPGDSDTETHPVTTTDPPNQPPSAAFSSTVDHLTAHFNATGSFDPEGGALTYAWDFGDGTSGTGVNPDHTYPAGGGTFTVTLTVTDPVGDDDVATGSVTATDPPVEIALDDFERVTVNGLGTSTVGGPWTITAAAGNYAVNGGRGRITGAVGATRAAYLTEAVSADVDMVADVSLDRAATGNGAFVSLVGRRVTEGNDHRVKLQYRSNGTVGVFLERYSGNVQTQLAVLANVPGLTVAPGDVLTVRFEVFGTSPTTTRAKVWRAGTPEPAAWMITNTSVPPALLQGTGHLGVHFYTSGSWTGPAAILSVDNLLAGPLP
jgi:PKD repeat protein